MDGDDDDYTPAARAWLPHVVLPPTATWKAVPWHGVHSIAPVPDERGRLVWATTLDTGQDRLEPLEQEGFVIDEAGNVIYGGPLTVIDHRTEFLRSSKMVAGGGFYEKDGGLQVRTTYLIPYPLKEGSYRIVTRAKEAHAWFKRDCCSSANKQNRHLGAASGWIPFRIGPARDPSRPARPVPVSRAP